MKTLQSTILLICFYIIWMTTALPAQADTTYIVQWGDTLSAIALRFNTTTQLLAQANGIVDPNRIYAGQQLIIPTGEPPAPDNSVIYVVQRGDNLYRISLRFGVSMQAIAQANGITNVNVIYVGQELIIPGVLDDVPTPPPATPTVPNPTATAPAATVISPSPTSTMLPPSPTSTTRPPSPTPTTVPPTATVVSSQLLFELGGQTQTLSRPDLMQQAGMTWVKYQHKWSPTDVPTIVTEPIAQARANGFKVLYSITGANVNPEPGAIDFEAFVAYLGEVAALPDPPDAIEVWNEMNIDFEWPAGEIDPESYVNNMLKPAYETIKAANPNIMVISGAPAPTGFDDTVHAWADDRYVNGMAAAGAASYMDCIGVHHNAGATAPSAAEGHPAGTHYSWYYGATRDLYYNAFDGERPICLTELGYLSGDGFDGLPPNFSWAADTSVAEHAQWLAEAADLSSNSGRVRLLIVFNVDFTLYEPEGDPQAGYAMLRPDGSCPACETLQAVMGE